MNLENINETQKIQFENKSLHLNQLENNNLKNDKIIKSNNAKNNCENQDSIKLFPQNIDDSTIIKKFNDSKDEMLTQFKSDNFEIKHLMNKDKNKLNDYEKNLYNNSKR